jgi:LPXTG-motif cell wall-anchored protein
MIAAQDPFNAPVDRYAYEVACSPGEIGYIVIVEEDIPTLTEWGLIIFGLVLIGFITWVFLKRRKAVAVSVVES